MKLSFAKTFARPALAATLAASIALSPVSAAPARAGNNEAGALAAAGFIALLLTGIAAANHGNGRVTVAPDPRDNGRRGDRRGPRIDTRHALPNECAFTIRRGRDAGTYYGRRCLKRNFDYWAFLPNRCEEQVNRRGRPTRNAFDATCLARFGYRDETSQRRTRN